MHNHDLSHIRCLHVATSFYVMKQLLNNYLIENEGLSHWQSACLGDLRLHPQHLALPVKKQKQFLKSKRVNRTIEMSPSLSCSSLQPYQECGP